MPLPVVLRIDGSKRPDGTNCRIEPDFCFLYRGRFVVLEIDGSNHMESPAAAAKRLLFKNTARYSADCSRVPAQMNRKLRVLSLNLSGGLIRRLTRVELHSA